MAQDITLDPAAVLAALEAKRTALEALIASWRAAIAVGALGPVTDMPSISTSVGAASEAALVELPQGAFMGKSVPEAIKLYLSVARRKQSIKEIATALKENGIESTSSNFEGVVTGALNRLKQSGVVLRFKDGWALAELYSEHFRARIANTGNGVTKKRSSAKRSKRVSSTRPAKRPRGSGASGSRGTQGRLIELLRSEPNAEHSAEGLSSALGAKIQVTHLLLGKLVAKKEVEKTAGGKYRAVAAAK